MEQSINEVSRKGKDALDKGVDKTKDLMDRASDKANSLSDKIQAGAKDLDISSYYDAVKTRTQDAVGASEDFITKYPFYTVLGAAAVGFLAAWITKPSRQ